MSLYQYQVGETVVYCNVDANASGVQVGLNHSVGVVLPQMSLGDANLVESNKNGSMIAVYFPDSETEWGCARCNVKSIGGATPNWEV